MCACARGRARAPQPLRRRAAARARERERVDREADVLLTLEAVERDDDHRVTVTVTAGTGGGRGGVVPERGEIDRRVEHLVVAAVARGITRTTPFATTAVSFGGGGGSRVVGRIGRATDGGSRVVARAVRVGVGNGPRGTPARLAPGGGGVEGKRWRRAVVVCVCGSRRRAYFEAAHPADARERRAKDALGEFAVDRDDVGAARRDLTVPPAPFRIIALVLFAADCKGRCV